MTDKITIKASINTHLGDDISDEMFLQIVADECNCEISDVIDVIDSNG